MVHDVPPSRSTRSARPRLVGALVLGMVLLLSAACGSADAGSPSSARPIEATPTISTIPTTTTTAAPTTTTTPRAVAGSALEPGAATIYALGDSVTLGAQMQVPVALTGWSLTFDAKENRRIDQGIEIVAARGGAMGRVLVVHLCTNWGGGDYHDAASRLMQSLKGVERVAWVTCTPWLPDVGDADSVIRALPNEFPNVVVADWAAISATPDYTYDDGLHLRTPGADALAALIARTVGPVPVPA